MRLCGISSRFQLLSPSNGQVTHALLTRPPLSHLGRKSSSKLASIQLRCFVRLACVKHAASVQSEPESNSPVQICIKISALAEIRISKFFPTRYSLVNEQPPTAFRQREKALSTFFRSLSTIFFRLRKTFFAQTKMVANTRKGLMRLLSPLCPPLFAKISFFPCDMSNSFAF